MSSTTDFIHKFDSKITAIFREPNAEEMKIDKAASQKEGRTRYVDQVICEVRIPGDNLRRPVFPAHAVWQRDGDRSITYAERFAAAYRAFLDGRAPRVEGTPIEELPYLTAAKRAELKALAVYSAEQLADLDSEALKRLGPGGRELKNQAEAYLKTKREGITSTAIVEENESLKAEIARLKAEAAAVPPPLPPLPGDKFDAMSDEQLREFIAGFDNGRKPNERQTRSNLLRLARDLSEG